MPDPVDEFLNKKRAERDEGAVVDGFLSGRQAETAEPDGAVDSFLAKKTGVGAPPEARPTPTPKPGPPSVEQMGRAVKMLELASGQEIPSPKPLTPELMRARSNLPSVRFRDALGDNITAEQTEKIANLSSIIAANKRLAELRADPSALGPDNAMAFTAPNGQFNLLVDPANPGSQQFHIKDPESAVQFLEEWGGLAKADPVVPFLWSVVYGAADAGTLGLLTGKESDAFMGAQRQAHVDRGLHIQGQAFGSPFDIDLGSFGARAALGGAELGGAMLTLGPMTQGYTAGLMRAGVGEAAAARIGSAMALGSYSAVGGAEAEAHAGGSASEVLIEALSSFKEGAAFGATASQASSFFAKRAAALPPRLQHAFSEAAGFAVAGQAIHGIDPEQAGVDAILGAILGAVRRKGTFLTEKEITDITQRAAKRGTKDAKRAEAQGALDITEAEVRRAQAEVEKVRREIGVEDLKVPEPIPLPVESGPVEMHSGGGSWIGRRVYELAKEVGGAARDWLASEKTALRSLGGSGEIAAEKVEAATAKAGDFEGFLRVKGGDRALEMSSGQGRESRRAVKELQDIQWEGDIGYSPMYEAVATSGRALGGEARKVYRAIQDVVKRRGEIAERIGAMTTVDYAPDGARIVDFFRNSQGDIMPRVISPDFISILKNGTRHPMWEKAASAIVEANKDYGLKRETVDRYMMDLHDALMQATPGEASQRISQLEHFRAIKRFPAAIKGDIGFTGQRIPVPLLETNPYRYVDSLILRGSGRLGYISEFGQDFGKDAIYAGEIGRKPREFGRDAMGAEDRPAEFSGAEKDIGDMIRARSDGAKLMERVSKEHGDKGRDRLRRVFRGLHGISPSPPVLTAGTRSEEVARGLRHAMAVVKSSLLTTNAVTNLPEPLGALRTFGSHTGGTPIASANARYLRDLGKMLSPLKSDRAKRRLLLEAARMNAAYTEYHANVSMDPMRPFESVVRNIRERSSRFFRYNQTNEFQEKMGAVRGLELAEMLQSGEAKGLSKFAKAELQADLESINFDRATAKRMIDGKGTKGEYDLLVQLAPKSQVASNLKHHELSRFENTRFAKFFIPFSRYASQVGLREHFSRYRVAWEAGRRMREAGYSKESMTEFTAALAKLGSSAAGKVAQQTALYLLYAGATGGTTGLKIAWNEIESNPIGMLAESYLFGVFNGPYGAILRSGGESDSLVNLTLPTSLGREAYLFMSGQEQYRGRSTWEKVQKLGSRYFPVARVAETAIFATGMMGQNAKDAHQMRVAEKAYWRYRFDRSDFKPNFPERDVTERWVHMRRMADAVKNLDPEGAEEHMKAYLGAPGASYKTMIDSIRSRVKFRAKRNPDGTYYLDPTQLNIWGANEDQRRAEAQRLRKTIGDDAFDALKAQDVLLLRHLNLNVGGR